MRRRQKKNKYIYNVAALQGEHIDDGNGLEAIVEAAVKETIFAQEKTDEKAATIYKRLVQNLTRSEGEIVVHYIPPLYKEKIFILNQLYSPVI